MSKRFPQPDLTQISQIDWARLAAFIDGEGCIRINNNHGATVNSRRVRYVEVTISNTDLRLGVWLKQTFGGSTYISRQKTVNPKWAPAVAWVVSTRHAAAILEHCFEYFIIKREQAEVALAFQATILPDRRYGRTGRPQAIIDQQRQLCEQLQTLKGTSSRAKRTALTSTIQ